MYTTGLVDPPEPDEDRAAFVASETDPVMAAPDVFATTVEPVVCTEVSIWLGVLPLLLPPAVQVQEKFEPALARVPLMRNFADVLAGTVKVLFRRCCR